jgi:hypothetical protein
MDIGDNEAQRSRVETHRYDASCLAVEIDNFLQRERMTCNLESDEEIAVVETRDSRLLRIYDVNELPVGNYNTNASSTELNRTTQQQQQQLPSLSQTGENSVRSA